MASQLLVPPAMVLVHDAAGARALFASIAQRPREIAVFAYLDPQWRLLGMRYTHEGEHQDCAIPVRHVVADALAFDAASVVMAHNHPSGDPSPSAADVAVTRRLVRALDALGVRLFDHVVLAGSRWASMRAMGLL